MAIYGSRCIWLYMDLGVYGYMRNSPCREEIGARASIRTCTFVCTSDCSYFFRIACAIQNFSIRNIEFHFAEACQMSHFGQNRVKQSYESKRGQSLVL